MKRSVLIIDDEAPIRQSFIDWFEDCEWRPAVAESGEQALEILETESPDCAIVAIRMGGMAGDEFIRKACRKNLIWPSSSVPPLRDISFPPTCCAFPMYPKRCSRNR